MEIVPYQPERLADLRTHFSRHWAESGEDGNYFLPFDLALPFRPRGIDPQGALKPVGSTGWQWWLLVLKEGSVVGHLGLKANAMEAASHRCELGMGLQRNARAQGIGTQLLERAIDFATTEPRLEWMDLQVMANNTTARQLYKKFGFSEVGHFTDRFRIDGRSLDEIVMTRAVSP